MCALAGVSHNRRALAADITSLRAHCCCRWLCNTGHNRMRYSWTAARAAAARVVAGAVMAMMSWVQPTSMTLMTTSTHWTQVGVWVVGWSLREWQAPQGCVKAGTAHSPAHTMLLAPPPAEVNVEK